MKNESEKTAEIPSKTTSTKKIYCFFFKLRERNLFSKLRKSL